MTNLPPPSYTPRQLETLLVLQRIKMAWVTFWFLLAIFSATFIALVFLIAADKGSMEAKVLVGAIDTLLGFSINTLVAYIFPSKAKST